MEQIDQRDLKTHDRTQIIKPPRPGSSQREDKFSKTTEFRGNRRTSQSKRDSTQKRTLVKVQNYTKSKKDSISTDISSKSVNSNVLTGKLTAGSVKRNASLQNKCAIQQNKLQQSLKKSTTKPKKKKKKTKTQIEQEKRRKMDLEEQERQQLEDEREQELLRFRYEQSLKLSQEERVRLEDQFSTEQNFILDFESKIYHNEKKRQVYKDWENYLDCNLKPNPDKENQMTQYLYVYDEKNQINGMDMTKILQNTDYCEQVIDELNTYYLTAKADNKTEKMSIYQSFIQKLRNITEKKWGEMTAYIMKNQQKLVDQRNEFLKEKNMTELSGDNLKQIANELVNKQQNKKYYELSTYYESDSHKYHLWINPVTKAGYRIKPIEFTQIGVTLECPRQYQEQLVIKCAYFQNDILSGNTLQFFNTVGGFYDIQCYKFLPLPMIRSRFMMVRTYDTVEQTLQRLDYPVPYFTGEQSELTGSLPLPQDQFIDSDNLLLGYFDEKLKRWVHDKQEIHITKVDLEENIVHFKTKLIRPLAFLQDKHSDFPYKSWFLRQKNAREALLDIVGKRCTFRFEFTEYSVTLRRCNISVLEPIFDKEMSVPQLLYTLKQYGINFLPENTDFMGDYEPYKKELDIENKALQEIIFLGPSFMIKSADNQQVSQVDGKEDRIFFQIRENINYETKELPSDEFGWKVVSTWCNKCGIYSERDYSKAYKNSMTHATVTLALTNHNLCGQDYLERINNMLYPELQNNIRKFLKLTRLVSFT